MTDRCPKCAAIAAILEAVDTRCLAADGAVTETRDEITAAELRQIYRLAKHWKARRNRERALKYKRRKSGKP